MANMNVTYSDMEAASSQLRNGQADIESRLSSLKGLVESLVSGGYVTDSSSVAFRESYQQFNDGVVRTVQGLEGMSQYLNNAATALRSTDEELARGLAR